MQNGRENERSGERLAARGIDSIRRRVRNRDMGSEEEMEMKAGELISQIVEHIDNNRMHDMQLALHTKLSNAGAGSEELAFVEQESYGGPCRCGVEWVKVEVKNVFAQFEYYEPDCRCYPRCQRCKSDDGTIRGKSLHGYVPPKMRNPEYTCPRCGAANPSTWRLTCAWCGIEGKTTDQYENYICNKCKKRSGRKAGYDDANINT